MKKVLTIFFVMFGFCNANAANITIFHSPSCPHCHHAREFIENELIYVYDGLKVDEFNVMVEDNRQKFIDTIKKCEYTTGGVPVIVVGEKCFQGYADSMQDELRASIEADLTDAQKEEAKSNKKLFDTNKTDFIKSHSERMNAVIYHEGDSQKKTDNNGNYWLIGFIFVLVCGIIIVLFKKQK